MLTESKQTYVARRPTWKLHKNISTAWKNFVPTMWYKHPSMRNLMCSSLAANLPEYRMFNPFISRFQSNLFSKPRTCRYLTVNNSACKNRENSKTALIKSSVMFWPSKTWRHGVETRDHGLLVETITRKKTNWKSISRNGSHTTEWRLLNYSPWCPWIVKYFLLVSSRARN